MSDTSLPIGDAYARAQLTAMRVQEQTGLTLAELAALPLDEFARLTCGQTPAEAAIAAFNAEQDAKVQRQNQAPAEQAPAQRSAPRPSAPEYQGIDVSQLSMEQYAQLRGQLGVGQSAQYGKGIFDSVSSQSQVYTDAVRAQAGRSAMSNAYVVEPPRIEGRYLDHDEQRDTRSVAQRFTTPGNAFGL